MSCFVRSNVLNKFKLLSTLNYRRKHVWTTGNVVVSPFRDVAIPDSTVVDYVWQGMNKWPTKTAVVCGVTNRSYTYEEMYKRSRTVAANLRKKFKLENGDAVAVMSPNNPEYPVVLFGVLEAGGLVTTLNPIYTAYEVQRQIDMSEVKLVIAHAANVPVVKEALKLSRKDLPIIAIDYDEPLPEGTISLKEMSEDPYADLSFLKDVKRKASDVALMPYSSGTTGLPKGTELTNRNIVVNCQQQNTELRYHDLTTESVQNSVLCILPLFHAYGLSIVMLHKLSAGLKLVTLPKFEPETFLNAMVQYQTNLLYLAPPLVLFLGSSPLVTSKHFDYVKSITSGAAPLPSADIEKILSKGQQKFMFAQGYGMTEAAPLVTINAPGSKEYNSVGYALPNIQLRVFDENMNNLGPRQAGELVIKGPNIMKGYKNNPDANKEVFLDGGWYRSGDVANIDENGLVYITDRVKELIKVKGYQVPPAELEAVLKEHPGVHDSAVIGIPDPKSGERPLAFVVTHPNANVSSEDIANFVNVKVAPYKRIDNIIFLDSIPKNASGKILRRVLKEKYV